MMCRFEMSAEADYRKYRNHLIERLSLPNDYVACPTQRYKIDVQVFASNVTSALTSIASVRGEERPHALLHTLLVAEEVSARSYYPSAALPLKVVWLSQSGIGLPIPDASSLFPYDIVGVEDGFSLLDGDSILPASGGRPSPELLFDVIRVNTLCGGRDVLIYSTKGSSAGIYRLPITVDDFQWHDDGPQSSSKLIGRRKTGIDVRPVTLDPITTDQAVVKEFSGLCHLISAAEMVGSSQGLLTATIAYTKTRRQFGAPVAEFQAVAHVLATAFVEIEVCRSALYELATREAYDDVRWHESYGIYSLCEQQLVQTCEELVRLHGASGLKEASAPGLYLRRVIELCGRYRPNLSDWYGVSVGALRILSSENFEIQKSA